MPPCHVQIRTILSLVDLSNGRKDFVVCIAQAIEMANKKVDVQAVQNDQRPKKAIPNYSRFLMGGLSG